MGNKDYTFIYPRELTRKNKEPKTFKDEVADWLLKSGFSVLTNHEADDINKLTEVDLMAIAGANKYVIKTVNTNYKVNEEFVEHFGDLVKNYGGKPVIITNGTFAGNALVLAKAMGIETINGSMIQGMNNLINSDKLRENNIDTLMGNLATNIYKLTRMEA